MKTPQIENEVAAIVAIGSFNPRIFQPLWFSKQGLIRDEEAESAKIQIIDNDVAMFSTEWFELQVLAERFAIRSTDPTKYKPLQDLVLSTFRILEHTPISAFGMNRNFHARVESEELWHEFWQSLAPKEVWETLLVQPGMRSLTIEGKRDESEADSVRIKVEPSVKFHPGLFVSINEHYQFQDPEEAASGESVHSFLQILNECWPDFESYSSRVVTDLWSRIR